MSLNLTRQRCGFVVVVVVVVAVVAGVVAVIIIIIIMLFSLQATEHDPFHISLVEHHYKKPFYTSTN